MSVEVKEDVPENEKYQMKEFNIQLQNEDIIRIHSLEKAKRLNGLLGKIVSFDKQKQRYHVRVCEPASTYNGPDQMRSIMIKSENLKPIFIQALLPPNRFAVCKICGECFRLTNGIEINNTCTSCLTITLCGEPCLSKYLFQHNIIPLSCQYYQKYCEFEIDSILKYSLFNTFEFNSLMIQGSHGVLNQFKFGDTGNNDGKFGSLTNNAVWSRMCDCNQSPYGELFDLTIYSKLSQSQAIKWDEFWHMPNDKHLFPLFNIAINNQNTDNKENNKELNDSIPRLSNWLDYFKYKKLSLKSPIAHFMSWPMTAYYSLIKYIGIDKINSILNGKKENNQIIIHVIGCEKELDFIPLYQELLCLFPNNKYKFHFIMFANNDKVSEKFKIMQTIKFGENDRLIFSIIKCDYNEKNINFHFKDKMLHIPHLAIGYNAGFETYETKWTMAIKYILKYKIASVFTEYCSVTCCNAKLLVQKLGGSLSVELETNPFRSCFIDWNKGSRFTCVRNGWIYAIYI